MWVNVYMFLGGWVHLCMWIFVWRSEDSLESYFSGICHLLFKKPPPPLGVAVHTFNLGTWEPEAGESL